MAYSLSKFNNRLLLKLYSLAKSVFFDIFNIKFAQKISIFQAKQVLKEV